LRLLQALIADLLCAMACHCPEMKEVSEFVEAGVAAMNAVGNAAFANASAVAALNTKPLDRSLLDHFLADPKASLGSTLDAWETAGMGMLSVLKVLASPFHIQHEKEGAAVLIAVAALNISGE
jgi:hypothetical protein